jgi:hypothetical protein
VPGEHRQRQRHDPTQQHKMSGKGWWNSAISGLESRLDGILTEEQANAKTKAVDAAGKQDATDKAAADRKLAVEPGG